ncbi:hypothetical protein O181_026190 [Austropuccinia psidii MF-1]|uniref:Uncharacterized protein n=1 Tax=Austropuccinia psidii MF-1 TaxID=1389203 RepID=A0A9Q3H1Y0_9BASI|nr:hypothetical protein [Austropuccinia psidii MF-1]
MWQAKRKAMVAYFKEQEEYIMISFAAKECLWLSKICFPLLLNRLPQLLSDNRTAIGIASDSVSRKQTWHLVWKLNLINELISSKKIQLEWVNTHTQLADIMKKSLGQPNAKKFPLKVNKS